MKRSYKNSRTLITGGAGFIGSHLAERLVSLGAHVTVLDNLSTGNLDNIHSIADAISFVEGSIIDQNVCINTCNGIDTIFHLAAEISVQRSFNDPLHALATNVYGTINILEAARLNKVQNLIFASSAAVYGNHEGICSEELVPEPLSTYGYSKFLGEKLCQLYSKSYNLKTVSLRFFNVYGPRQNTKGGRGGVLAVFDEMLRLNKPITIFGDGLQTRDFVPVQKVVEALLAAGLFDNDYAQGHPFNIGSGTSTSLQDQLAQLMKNYPDYDHQIIYARERPGDIKHSWADCSKFQKTLEL